MIDLTPPDDQLPKTTWDLLHQRRWWKDVNGEFHELATMDPRHRDNLLPFLRRRASKLRNDAHYDASRQFYAAPDEVYEEAMQEFDNGFSDEGWLNLTPLVMELRRYDQERSRIGRLRTWSHNRTYKLRKRMGWARS